MGCIFWRIIKANFLQKHIHQKSENELFYAEADNFLSTLKEKKLLPIPFLEVVCKVGKKKGMESRNNCIPKRFTCTKNVFRLHELIGSRLKNHVNVDPCLRDTI